MTAQEFRNAIAELGLNQVQASKALRVAPRTVRNWVAGDAKIPGPVEVLIEGWRARGMPRSVRDKL